MSWAALMYACEFGHRDIAEDLLDAGANINLQDLVRQVRPLLEFNKL